MSGFCEVMGASSDREVWKIPVYRVPAVLFFGDVPEPHVNFFGVCLTPTYTYSEWSRLAKLAQGVVLLQVGGDEVSAEGKT